VLASYLLVFVYVGSPWLDVAHLLMPAWLRWVGGGVLVVGTGLFWWTHQVLGRNWSGILEIYQNHTLVTAGPYRWIRHPMYLAFFVVGAGLFLLSANGLIGLTNLGSVAWMYRKRAPEEEAMLLEHFGDSYDRYMHRTGRLLPRIRA
jgi:protein-S-isoprenylcysteine O-methyltransferase Ste14